MKFIAIDIETTGLESQLHSITEFAAIFADTDPAIPVKTFYRWMNPEGFVWSNFCLNLHYDWIKKVVKRVKESSISPPDEPILCLTGGSLVNQFCQWLLTECDHPIPKGDRWEKLTAAGKNFHGFDHRFLETHGFPAMFRHRSIDPVMLYAHANDIVLPELKLCKERAIAEGCPGLVADVAHNAIDDAMDVVKLVQWGMRNR